MTSVEENEKIANKILGNQWHQSLNASKLLTGTILKDSITEALAQKDAKLEKKLALAEKMAEALKKINEIVSARNDDGLDTNKIVEEVLSLWEQGKKV